MKRKSMAICLLVLGLIFNACAYGFELGTRSFFDNPPPARLLYPTRENVSLEGRASLEFQWMDPIPINTGAFIFRLYKGYDTVESNLIVREQLDRDAGSISIAADKFENNTVYTWTLTRVDDYGRKSDKPSASFTLLK